MNNKSITDDRRTCMVTGGCVSLVFKTNFSVFLGLTEGRGRRLDQLFFMSHF